jgi:hypothetical protein
MRAGQALGRFAGLGGRAAGRKPWRPKWDYDSVEGWKRPLWQRPTTVGGGTSRGPGGKFVGGAKKQPGWINRLYMNPTTWQGKALRMGGLGLGGSIALDRLRAGGEEKVSPLSGGPSWSQPDAPPTWTPSEAIASRAQFQKNQAAKQNQMMKQLLLNYGIVNLVNPDSAADMLKIGMGIVEQQIKETGNERQAAIFDSVFDPKNMPKSAKEVYDRVMKAHGSEKDASEIAGTYVSMRPPAPAKTSVDQRAMEILRNAQVLYSVGRRGEADNLIRNAILAKIIKVPTESGLEKNIEELIALVRESITGAGGTPRNTGGITITRDEK